MTPGTVIKIREKQVGSNWPCYLIAEIGNNHNGDPERARELIRAAHEAGVDAVKFQTFKAKDIVSPKVPANAYPGWDVSDRYSSWIEFVETLELPYEAYDELISQAHTLGLDFISTPASLEALEFLVEKRVDAIKIASMDLNNIPFLQQVSQTGLPVILSTGMSTLEEIQESVQFLSQSRLALLHCVSNYPLKYQDANLLNIVTLQETFSVPVGFSNHALGHDLDIAAVALGARILEKHFTLSRKEKQIAEHHFSMEPSEFKEMVDRVRTIEHALGSRMRSLTSEEEKNRSLARRSIAVKRNLRAGKRIEAKDLLVIRPGTGIEPKHLTEVIGRRLQRSVEAFQTLTWSDIDGNGAKLGGKRHQAIKKVTQNGYDVVLCEPCGYWHVYPMPDRETLDRYYQGIYFQNPTEHGDMKDKNTDPDGYYRLKYMDKLINFEALMLPRMPKTILDIGAGYGEFLEFMKDHGWTVYGVEPSEYCLQHGRGAACGIIHGDLESLENSSLPKASVITLNTVLEHHPAPEKLLVTLRDHLMEKDTILHVEVPNDFSLLQECVKVVCNPRKYWVCPIGHLNYWSHSTFTAFVRRLGFRIEALESTFPLEILAMLGDDYISDPAKGRPMHLKRVDLEKRFAAYGATQLKLGLYKRFAQVGMGREILAYMRME